MRQKPLTKTPRHFGNSMFPIAQLLADRHNPTRKFWPNESQNEGSRALGTPNPVPAPALLSSPFQQSSSIPWMFIPHPGCSYPQFLSCQECRFLSFPRQNWETLSHLPCYFLVPKFILLSQLELKSITFKLLQKRFLVKGSVLWLQEGFHWNTLMEDICFPCFSSICKALRGFVNSLCRSARS